MPRKYPLTEQQRLFAREYASLSNATQAAINSGYSLKSARRQGTRLANHPDIVALVAEIKGNTEAQAQRLDARALVDNARLLRELEYPALLDTRMMFGDDGRLLDPVDMPECIARSIASMKIKQDEEGRARFADIKLIDKLPAIKLIGQELGMFKDQHVYEHKLADMTDEELAAEAERLAQVHREQATQAELHGVELGERRH